MKKKVMMYATVLTMSLGMVLPSMGTVVFANDTVPSAIERSNDYIEIIKPINIQISDNLFLLGEVIDENATPMGIYKYEVIGNGVRVRTRPSLSATILGTLYRGDIVYSSSLLDYADGIWWKYVNCSYESNMPEKSGYLDNSYIREIN